MKKGIIFRFHIYDIYIYTCYIHDEQPFLYLLGHSAYTNDEYPLIRAYIKNEINLYSSQ